MHRAAPPPLATLRSSEDVLAAVPHLLGLHPSRSLVVLALGASVDPGRPGRCDVVATLRADLPSPRTRHRETAEVLGGMVLRTPATRAVLAVYDDEPPHRRAPAGRALGRQGRRRLAAALVDVLGAGGVEVVDAVHVVGGRWTSLLCRSSACCPEEGHPVPDSGVSPVAAVAAWRGRAVLPDRDALVRSLDADPAAAAAVARARDESPDLVLRPPSGHVGLWLTLRDGWSPRVPLDPGTVATLLVALEDVGVRDVVLRHLCEDAAGSVPLLLAVLRAAPEDAVAPVASLLAWCAYLGGEGALANVALDRALRTDPDYSLARLAELAMGALVPPDVLLATLREALPVEAVTQDGADAPRVVPGAGG